ncbi:MAG: acyl-CoA dehydrogenase C-terminal domain-containing protein, partial [Myxococcales bacterium]|nr:acyl-CoA dehydrogenase C-terminal domain-containing protein [Myxococcales bacterium]
YLRLFGLVALGYVWCRTAQCALRADGGLSAGFYQAKLDTARFYMDRMLPETGALLAGIMADGDTVMGFDEAAF